MPIVFNNSAKNTEATPPTLDTYSKPNTRSRRTLSTGSLHRLKKEVGVSLQQNQHQEDHERDSSGKDRHPSSSSPSPTPLSSCSVDCEPKEHNLPHPNPHPHPHPHRDHTHNYQRLSNKDTIPGLLVTTTRREEDNISQEERDNVNDSDNDNNNSHSYLLKQRGYDRGTPSPSPSLSPPPSSPTSSVSSSDSHSDQTIYEDKTSANKSSFAPLSPPASATTSLPPPSILSSNNHIDNNSSNSDPTALLYSPVSSPEGTEPDEPTTPAALPLLLEKTQTQLEHTSLARRTNTARSSHPPLAPSSLWVSSSERRGNESEHDDESRTKRRRSMGSSDQSLSYAENDGRIKGVVVCPLSPPSSQLASSALDALVSISNDDGDEQQSVVAPDSVAVKLETVSEGCEPSSETTSTTTTTTPTPTTASTPQGRNMSVTETNTSISGEDRAECAIEPDYTQRPPISYAGLIIQVLLESTKIKMTLADIYAAIMQKHPYYRHAASGWQNSVRNSLSLNKAFAKVDRTPDEPGHGCFWALQDHVRDSSDPFPCRKRKAPQSDSTTATRSKGAALPKLDCVVESPSERSLSLSTPFLDSAPSPAASEDAEDLKSPRRSGRARRPPRPKEAEDYIGLNTRQPSLINASLSTPPSSPAPYGQDREVTPVTAPARKRASSVKVEKIHSSTAINHPNASRDETPLSPATARKAVNDVDLASIPGVVTTQRIRRPPQNLAEFVSSEDFKAAPCGKRTLQPSTSSSSLNGPDMDTSPREKKEAKRSKSESHISFSHSGKRASPIDADHQNTDPEPQRENFDRSPSVPNLPAASRLSHLNPNAGPAIIPLSALSHSKRASRDFSGKKQRRDPSLANGRSKSLYSKRHSSHEVPTREQILERRRRDGKRESMVASDDDWSDSDFDFLRDEEENYRLMRIRVRKIQKTCGRWSLREVNDRYGDVLGDDDLDSEDENSRAEGEKIKLLLDPSVINYGFDSCDSEYILDYHQGPLFNNVTWPEFSDVKEDSNNGNSNGNGSSNNPSSSNSSNPCNLSHPSIPSNSSNVGISDNETEITGTIVDNHVLESVADTQVPDLVAEQVNIDPQVVAEVLSALTKSVVLGSELTPPIECISNMQVPSSPLPLTTPNGCTDGKTRKQEADEWALFVGNCGPKMECNTGANRRNVDIESEARLKDISPLEHVLPDSEIEAVVAAVSSGVVAEASRVQMEGIIAEAAPVTAGIKEDIEVDDFIGWSLCE